MVGKLFFTGKNKCLLCEIREGDPSADEREQVSDTFELQIYSCRSSCSIVLKSRKIFAGLLVVCFGLTFLWSSTIGEECSWRGHIQSYTPYSVSFCSMVVW